MGALGPAWLGVPAKNHNILEKYANLCGHIMRETVLLLGASGSMGFVAFKELWSRLDDKGERKYDIVLLLRPSEKNKKLFGKKTSETETYYHQIFFHYVLQDGNRAHCAWDRAR